MKRTAEGEDGGSSLNFPPIADARWMGHPSVAGNAASPLDLCGAASSGGQFADMVEEDGALEFVELRGVGGDLGEEGVGGEDCGLVGVAGVGVAQERGDVHLERAGEAVERGKRRHGLAVLDLRDVGARDAHAGGELALRKIADVAKIAHRGGDLEATLFLRGCGDERDRGRFGLGQLHFKTLVAAPA